MRHVVFRWLAAMTLGLSVLMPLLSFMLVPNFSAAPALPRLQGFLAKQLGEAVEDPARRQRLLEHAASELDGTFVYKDIQGHELARAGAPCSGPALTTDAIHDGRTVGRLTGCLQKGYPHLRGLAMLILLMSVLWAVSGRIAHRISRPLSELSRVAQRIGSGDFSARARSRLHRIYELRELASTLDDMAERLERQQEEQRELLAAVSHELRSPLSRMQVALSIAQKRQVDPQLIASLEEEIRISDKLVSDMLANARLDFKRGERVPLRLHELVQATLRRRQLSNVELQVSYHEAILGDATLLTRALENLLDNAERHGGGVSALHIHRAEGLIWLQVCDRGPGFSDAALPHIFKSFYRAANGGVQGLGLGLSLVQRIAQAHGGHARASNLAEGGACVAIGVREN